jgi:uncharacterized protein YcnI
MGQTLLVHSVLASCVENSAEAHISVTSAEAHISVGYWENAIYGG